MNPTTIATITPDLPATEKAVYRKVTRRLIPFLFLCYILSYVDRVNVGFAKLQMQQDLGMSDTVFGAGMGIFFIGYFILEVPSNLMLQRVGARRWIGPIMIVWGVVSSVSMFARTALMFYVLRFLLGVVESGFFPGVVLYLTFWYPRAHRAKMVAAFMSAIALSGAFGGPVSGWIMSRTADLGGLAGWQWLFLLEGIPSVLLGIIAIFYLNDGPGDANWLRNDERQLLLKGLAEEEALKKEQGESRHSLADVFKSPKVWLFCLVYFGLMMANYFVSFWMPQIIKDNFAKDPWQIGLISSIPWGFAALCMIYWGYRSDLKRERRWHLAAALVTAALFLVISGTRNLPPVPALIVLALMTAGIMSGMSTFWALPTAVLSGTAAAAGIAWINSVGNLGGFVSPYLIGWIRDRSSNPIYPPLVIAICCLTSAFIMLLATHKRASSNGTHSERTR